MHVECAQGVAIERGDEDDDRDLLGRERLQEAEAVELRHLHVEQHDVRDQGTNSVDRSRPVTALGDDLHVGIEPQQAPQTPPCHRLVIDDERAQRHTPVTCASVCQGIESRTMVPVPSALATSKPWAGP